MYTCTGYIDMICEVHQDSRPTVLDLFGGKLCLVSDNESCEVHVNAVRFAINALFSCKIEVSTE